MSATPGMDSVIVQGIDEGLHLGAQVYVSLHGKVIADTGIGEARPGVPMTRDQMIIWWSMTKPSVAVATAQLWERGAIDLDDRVAVHVPEFAQKGKEAVTIRHLLTHTGGFRSADGARGEWDAVVAKACEAPLEPHWVPGETAGYHLTAGMTMLAEVLRRVDGRGFDAYIRDEVFVPLGMDDCWVGMPPERAAEYGNRLGTMFNTEEGAAGRPEGAVGPVALDALDTPDQLRRVIPGGGGRGPMRQLARLYEMLRGKGELDGVRVLSPQTVEAITAKHRVGLLDKTFGAHNTWGLGFGIDAYNMGRHCSRRAFGHGGARSSQAFTDPDHGLVAVVQTNGMCAIADHQRRFSEMFTALYVDLELAPAGSPGRNKEPGKYA